MTDPTPRHPAYDLTVQELRDVCRRYLHGTPRGGLSRAKREDLLTWVIVNGLLERRDALLKRRSTLAAEADAGRNAQVES